MLIPRRQVVELTLAWVGRFRRLATEYERLPQTLEGWHRLAAIVRLLAKAIDKSA